LAVKSPCFAGLRWAHLCADCWSIPIIADCGGGVCDARHRGIVMNAFGTLRCETCGSSAYPFLVFVPTSPVVASARRRGGTRHMGVECLDEWGSFGCVDARFARIHCAQDDKTINASRVGENRLPTPRMMIEMGVVGNRGTSVGVLLFLSL
jgi:hypothetical protein